VSYNAPLSILSFSVSIEYFDRFFRDGSVA
jgi:hypothetical protein